MVVKHIGKKTKGRFMYQIYQYFFKLFFLAQAHFNDGRLMPFRLGSHAWA
jgi:hypothetical protein